MAHAGRKRTAAALALLCLAAVFFGDAARGIHLLTARHVLCAAHGELVEAEAPGTIDAADDGGVAGAWAGDDAEHHDHCSIAAAPTGPSAARVPDAGFAGVAPVEEAIVAAPTPPLARTRLVLAYAPKQGPPVRPSGARLRA